MSYTEYDDRPRRQRSRRTREPEYVEETTYVQRGAGLPSRDLVYRPRDDDVEDIPRDFPPPGAEYRRTKYREKDYGPRRARSMGRRDYSDDDYDDYAYSRSGRGRSVGRRGDGYYSDDYDRPKKRERRKSKVGEILEDLGLGGLAGAVAGKVSGRSKSRDRHDRYLSYSDDDYDRSRSRSRGSRRGNETSKKWQQAAQAALVAGAVEAFRSRKEPGPWTGEKGTRIATAALGAAGIDGLVDRDPRSKGKRHIAEAVLGGLVANRVANGPRDRSGSRGRSRSRSRSRSILGRSRSRGGGRSQSRGGGAVKDLVGAGALAAAGKAIYDRVRSKSRSRKDRSRDSSTDSFVPSRSRNYDRGRDRGPPPEAYGPPPVDGAARGGRSSSTDSESTTDMENKRKKMGGKELLTAGLATVATIQAARGVYSYMQDSKKRRKLVAEGEMSKEDARKRKSKNILQDAAAVGIAALGIKSAFSEWKGMNEQRHTLHGLEEKRRIRRKQREKRERGARQQFLMNGSANPYGGYPGPQYGGAPTYADANPYSAGNLPPPPMGHAPAPRY